MILGSRVGRVDYCSIDLKGLVEVVSRNNTYPYWDSDVRIVACPICEYTREVHGSVVIKNREQQDKHREKLRNRRFEGETQLCQICSRR